MATIRVTGIQMTVSSKFAENLEKILQYIKDADADFILFPEVSLVGFNGSYNDESAKAAWRQIATACRNAYVTAIIGTGARVNGTMYIQSRIYTDDGSLLGTHEKLIPTQRERLLVRPGEELRVFQRRGISFGCLISNDFWVAPGMGPYPDPKLAYQLGKKGAHIIFHSMCSGMDCKYEAFFESNLVLRAQESGVYIATVNAAVADGPVNATTGILSPQGEWLAKCPREGERQYTHDIEIDVE